MMKQKRFRSCGLVFLSILFTFQVLAQESGDSEEFAVSPDRVFLGCRLRADNEGLRVEEVEPGGPADQAGLIPGDVIAEINGDILIFRDDIEAVKWLDRYKAGQVLGLSLIRGGQQIQVDLLAGSLSSESVTRMSSLLRKAQANEGACASDSRTLPAANDAENDRTLAFLKSFPQQGAMLRLVADPEGKGMVRVEVDEPFVGRAPDLASLPGFLQNLARGLKSGETVTFRVEPSNERAAELPTISLVSGPAHLRALLKVE